MCAPTPISTHAIENLVDGAFFNSGQSCCGIERIYVHKKVYERLRRRLRRPRRGSTCSAIPLDEATTLGPMVKAEAADFVRKQIAEAVRGRRQGA